MISNVNVNELLFSDLMIKEPVDGINSSIGKKISRRKIILTGGRGSGKSVILGSRENKSLKSEHPSILTSFDDSQIITKDKMYFDKEFIEHYYEVIMSKKLLDYVKKYYPELFASKFTNLDYLVSSRLAEVDYFINNVEYKNINIKNKLLSGQLVSSLLLLFKNETNVKDVTLMVDRFDWTHNSNPDVQNILSNYFDVFERVIITSDDEALMLEERISDLSSRGFEIIASNYSRDPEVVKQIIKRRFEFDNGGKNKFPIGKISNSDYERLIEISGGNINMIIASFMDTQIQYRCNGENDDFTKTLENACNQKLEGMQLLRKKTKVVQFHL